MPMMPGKTALRELLKQEGISTIFGNPGTTELPPMGPVFLSLPGDILTASADLDL